MLFGNYGEILKGSKPVGLVEAVNDLSKNLDGHKRRREEIIKECFDVCGNCLDRVNRLESYPDINKEKCKEVTQKVNLQLNSLLSD